MQIIVNTDHHLTGSEDVTARVEWVIGDFMKRFADRVTRVEVFLSDVNGPKHGAKDKRCVMEARVAGAAPVAATEEAPSLIAAIDGAGGKLERALDHAFGRLRASASKATRIAEAVGSDDPQPTDKPKRR